LFIVAAWGLPDLLAAHRQSNGRAEAGADGPFVTTWRAGLALPLTWAGALALCACLILTRTQLNYWQNGVTLFARAVEVDPDNYAAHSNLGNALADQGRLPQAEWHFREALRLRPDYAEAHYFLGGLLQMEDRLPEAAAELEKSIHLDPRRPAPAYHLAEIFLRQGRVDSAVALFSQAIRLAPDRPPYLDRLARIYATSPLPQFRNGAEAVRLAERACALTQRRDAHLLDTLSAAYAEAGKFDDAITTAQEAQAVALSSGDGEAANAAAQKLALYRTRQPYREQTAP
jgi:tetratricopeptide (TPR) repeat protein